MLVFVVVLSLLILSVAYADTQSTSNVGLSSSGLSNGVRPLANIVEHPHPENEEDDEHEEEPDVDDSIPPIPEQCKAHDHAPHRPHRVRLDPASIPKYTEQLQQPKRMFSYESTTGGSPIQAASVRPTQNPLNIPVSEFTSQILPRSFTAGPYNGRTLVWGYDNTYPGPTIESRRGTPMQVEYPNLLDAKTTKLHIDYFDIDPVLMPHDLNLTSRLELIPRLPGRPPLFRYVGPIPHVTHLHGSEVESAADGHPEAWYTYQFDQVGHGFIDKIHHHPQQHEAMTLWYHDHSMGITRFTVFAGISGFNLLRDPEHEPVDLPNTQPYEMEMVLQDRDFDVNGQLMYIQPDEANAGHAHSDNEEEEDENSRAGQHEFFGDFIVVNGRTWPEFQVEPRRYRFRMLNGANARFFNLSFQASNRGSSVLSSPSIVPWWIIGTEGGLLDHAAPLRSLLLGPAERADVMVDFSGLSVGDSVIWNNSAPADFPSSARLNEHASQVMRFSVIPLKQSDTSLDPRMYEQGGRSLRPNNPIVRLSPNKVDLTRHLTLVQIHQLKDHYIIPHTYMLNNQVYHSRATETPVAGSTELWELINLTSDTHPIHLHLIQFQLLSRQRVNGFAYNDTYSRSFPGGDMIGSAGPPRPPSKEFPGGNPSVTPFLIGSPRPAPPEESGWKDVIRSNPGEVTRILVRYAPLEVPLNQVQPGMNLYPFTPFGKANVVDPLTGLRTGHSYIWHCHMLDHEDNDMMRSLGSH